MKEMIDKMRRAGSSYPPAVVDAYERGCEIQKDSYQNEKCKIELIDLDASNWQIKVTRMSDSDVTTDTIPKD